MHQQSASHMGTKWHIALYSRDTNAANRAFAKSWSVIEEIDNRLTNYEANSELNQLCRSSPHATAVKVSDHLWHVLREAHKLSKQTDGAFDVTIGPISKLWRRSRRKKHLPDQATLAAAKHSVGYRLIQYKPDLQSVRLANPKMQIDLGGIAKGYAVDRAIDVLLDHGVKDALVNGGGDLRVIGSPPGKPGWTVEVSGIRAGDDRKSMVLTNAAIATSGDAWQYVTIGGVRYSHIIDPRTGLGTTQSKTVTVKAPTCIAADGLASALSVLPPIQGTKLVDTRADTEARIVLLDDDDATIVHTTDGFPR